MHDSSRKAMNNKNRKFDSVKKFGVKKRRWEVESAEIASLEARIQDLDSVRSRCMWYRTILGAWGGCQSTRHMVNSSQPKII